MVPFFSQFDLYMRDKLGPYSGNPAMGLSFLRGLHDGEHTFAFTFKGTEITVRYSPRDARLIYVCLDSPDDLATVHRFLTEQVDNDAIFKNGGALARFASDLRTAPDFELAKKTLERIASVGNRMRCNLRPGVDIQTDEGIHDANGAIYTYMIRPSLVFANRSVSQQ